ncbi:DMT family transporter [Isosphaeraceae bacterium EP7]
MTQLSPPGTQGAADRRRGRLYILGAATLWSAGGFITKRLEMDPLSIAFYRSLFAGLALLPLVPRSKLVFRPSLLPLGLAFGAMTGLYLTSVKLTSAANAIFLQCTATLWTVPIGLILLRERPSRREMAGIAMAMVGIITIVAWGRAEGNIRPRDGEGILLGLTSGIAYAAVVVGLRALRDLDPLWTSAAGNLVAAATLGAWLLLTAGAITVPTPGQVPVLVAFGAIQLAIPYVLFARGLRTIHAPEAALLGLLEPVLSPIWVILFVGEYPELATVVGGVFLLAGVAVRYLPARRATLPSE